MRTITLTQGKSTIVDDRDYERLSRHKWRAHACRLKNGVIWYAVRTVRSDKPGQRQTTVRMHRVLLDGVPEVDHRDGNGLHNWRGNLRPATRTQNLANSRKIPGRSSRFKGVCWNGRDKRWSAYIGFHYKHVYIGYFRSELAAARAYDRVARELFGEFAKSNFPLEGDQ